MKNQKGFSLLEALVIMLILGLVATVGWLVYDRQKSPDRQSTGSQVETKDDAPKKTEVEDETTNWEEVKNAEFGYSYKFPQGEDWESYIVKSDPNSQLYQLGERINNTGVNYLGCGKNCGLVFSFGVALKGSSSDVGVNYVESTQMKDNNTYKLSSKTTVTKNGVEGTRWEYDPGNVSVAKIVYYYFATEQYSYFVQVNSNGAVAPDINLTERGEKIFSTFQFIK